MPSGRLRLESEARHNEVSPRRHPVWLLASAHAIGFGRSLLWRVPVDAFLKRVGTDYPQPRVAEGNRKLWLRADLDAAILPDDLRRVQDVAEDL